MYVTATDIFEAKLAARKDKDYKNGPIILKRINDNTFYVKKVN